MGFFKKLFGENDNEQTKEYQELLQIIKKAKRDGVTALDLSGKGIKVLPPEISQLTNLTELVLSHNAITDVAPLAALTNLTELLLSYNKITDVTPLAALTNLTGLVISSNQITDVAPLAHLTNLTVLRLENNQITDVAPLAALTNLTKLGLNNNQITDVAPLAALTNLTKLGLSNNQITDVAPLAALTNLTWLRLNNNQITDVSPLLDLIDLVKPRLNNNQITDVSPLLYLTDLVEPRLYNNQITDLALMLAPNELIELWLDNNPITYPPPEIVNQGIRAICAYLHEQLNAQQPQWVSKLIIVGEGGVGKTSLLKCLRAEPFNTEESTTHGIRVSSLPIPHPQKSEVTMQLNTWDFGGQDIYHATHQFFLTNRSLFLMAWNARYGYEQGKIYYWLNTLKSIAPDSPIILVGTHIDERPEQIPIRELQQQYPQIVGYVQISSKTQQGMDQLQALIATTAANLPLMGEKWPTTWVKAAQAIRRSPEKYISPNRLEELIISQGVAPDNVKSLTQFLHDLGDILYFQDNTELENIVILQPQWLTEYISKVLTCQAVIDNSAIFTRSHQTQIWRDLEPHVRTHFLHLMERFDLSFPLNQDGNNPGASLIVELLKEDAPHYENRWNAQASFPEMSMKWKVNQIPAGIPTWFIAREYRFSTGIHWRSGVLLSDGQAPGHLALVRVFKEQKYLELTVRGARPFSFFNLLKDGIELLLARFPGLEIKRFIPCTNRINQCTQEFDVKNLEKRFYELGKPTKECDCGEDIPIIKLLHGLDGPVIPDLATTNPGGITAAKMAQGFNLLLSRLNTLEQNISAGQDSLQGELNKTQELLQGEFLKMFQLEQSKIDSECPNIFVLRPQHRAGWRRALMGEKIDLHLYCQMPGCLHPVNDGGVYTIDNPAKWLKIMAPYIRKMIQVLKVAKPFFGPWVRLLNAEEYAQFFVNDIGLMNQLVDHLPGLESDEDILPSRGGMEPLEMVQGASFRALRELLEKQDKSHHWGDLTKVITKEGHILWLCKYHVKEARDKGMI